MEEHPHEDVVVPCEDVLLGDQADRKNLALEGIQVQQEELVPLDHSTPCLLPEAENALGTVELLGACVWTGCGCMRRASGCRGALQTREADALLAVLPCQHRLQRAQGLSACSSKDAYL